MRLVFHDPSSVITTIRSPSGTPQMAVGLGLPSLVNVVSSMYLDLATSAKVSGTAQAAFSSIVTLFLMPPRSLEKKLNVLPSSPYRLPIASYVAPLADLCRIVGGRLDRLTLGVTASVARGDGHARGVADPLDLPGRLLRDRHQAVTGGRGPDGRRLGPAVLGERGQQDVLGLGDVGEGDWHEPNLSSRVATLLPAGPSLRARLPSRAAHGAARPAWPVPAAPTCRGQRPPAVARPCRAAPTGSTRP